MLAKTKKTGATESYWVNDFVGKGWGLRALERDCCYGVIIFKERLRFRFIVRVQSETTKIYQRIIAY